MKEHKITWSFSALKTYKTCARKYHAETVLKLYPRTETEATRYGTELHKAFEEYLRDGAPLKGDAARFKATLDKVKAIPGTLLCEHEMGLKRDLTPCAFTDEGRWVRGIADVVILNEETTRAYVLDWKGLAVDTKLPTPNGFTTMGEVKVGDQLFAEDGSICTVIGKSDVKNIRCFKVCFDDTTSVVCDENHLWKLHDGAVVPVTELDFTTYSRKSKIRVAAPLKLPDVPLPIDPYVLGLWLADGKHTSGEVTKPDDFVWEEVQRRGYFVNMKTGGNKRPCPQRTIHGLCKQLSAAGLLGNKHIPPQYLRAGYQQRLDLLRGLMDGDGNVNEVRKQCVFTTTDRRLSLSVQELLLSLGQRALVSVTTQRGFGLTVTAYPISFKPIGLNPFLLPRKKDRVSSSWGSGKSWRRLVVRVEEVPSVPTQCIAVDSHDNTFLCTESMIPTHNSGSAKYPDKSQLCLMALMLFAHYPWVEEVKGALAFVNHSVLLPNRYYRKDIDKLWKTWQDDVAKLEASYANDAWHANPNGLCRKWCPVTHCEHNGE